VAPQADTDPEGVRARIEALPGAAEVRAAASETAVDAFFVGGSVRDALLGRGRADLDVLVVGDHLALARALGGETVVHDRFATATVAGPHGSIDLARARAESYPSPGALPEVRPAGLAEDLARRDFTINAMAVPVTQPGELIDPHGGRADLRSGLLRVLHDGSFSDDPTRALRAARYAARLGFEIDDRTLELLRAADLATVSADRVAAELARIAGERELRGALELVRDWELIALDPELPALAAAAAGLVSVEPWADLTDRSAIVVDATLGTALAQARALAAEPPESPWHAVAAARGRSPVVLVLARVLGAEWLDTYLTQWSRVRLEITGEDLLAEGVEQGPAVGRGLSAALRAKLEGTTRGRADELRVALEGARGPEMLL